MFLQEHSPLLFLNTKHRLALTRPTQSVPAGTFRSCASILAFGTADSSQWQPKMFLQEHWTRFAHTFTYLHSTSSLHLNCEQPYSANGSGFS
jgi:hypothetical protein